MSRFDRLDRESIADPLGYYENNTCKTRALLKSAHHLSSTTAAHAGPSDVAALIAKDAACTLRVFARHATTTI